MTNGANGRQPLVLVGFDVGEPDLLTAWAADGALPLLAGVMGRGWSARIGGADMVCEYGVALSAFSGVSRSRHEYYYSRQQRPGTYELQRVNPPVEAAPPFWSLLGDEGRVLVVDVPELGPIAGLPGVQLADWQTRHSHDRTSRSVPPDAVDEARRLFGPPMPIQDYFGLSPDAARGMRDRCIERARRTGRVYRGLMERGPFDVAALFFGETHGGSHALWPYRAGAGADGRDDAPDLRHGLRDVFAAVNAEMAGIVERAGPDANVVVMSIYGLHDQRPSTNLIDLALEELGFWCRTSSNGGGGPGVVAGAAALARRVVPDRVRESLLRHLPGRAQERLLTTWQRDTTDWSRTTAFAVPGLSTSFVRVNLAGREPQGIVAPGAEYDEVLDRIEAELALLHEPDGTPVVARTARATRLFGGDPPARMPDLFVEWRPESRPLEVVEHPRATLRPGRAFHWFDSEERVTGFVAAAGPAFANAGDLGEVDVLDLAPTFLAALGRDVPPAMTGRPLGAALR